MGKGGRPKKWPRSWHQAALVGGPLVLKGRAFEKAYVVVPLRVEAGMSEELRKEVERTLVAETEKQKPS